MKHAKVVDLFCGAGGLTYGLERAGLNVVEGVDVDERCRYAYEINTKARFIAKDVRDYDVDDAGLAWGDAAVRILVGCAPCQPFSTYAQGIVPHTYGSRFGRTPTSSRWRTYRRSHAPKPFDRSSEVSSRRDTRSLTR